jgi:hypothetical protein
MTSGLAGPVYSAAKGPTAPLLHHKHPPSTVSERHEPTAWQSLSPAQTAFPLVVKLPMGVLIMLRSVVRFQLAPPAQSSLSMKAVVVVDIGRPGAKSVLDCFVSSAGIRRL